MVSTRFTNRNGGISQAPYASFNLALHVGDDDDAVRENRNHLARAVGPSAFMSQVHGNRVVVVDGISPGEPIADALVTAEAAIALVVLVADCIPLLLWDESAGCIAVAHVGRRGLVNGITGKVLEVMVAMGACDLHAQLGPSICGKCYGVGREIYDEVGTLYPYARSETRHGALALDLPGALSRELIEMGVQVTRSDICTAEDGKYFSYRRDGITGRQAGVIWL